jgi:quercetin dioxygenase-like cupin family protein
MLVIHPQIEADVRFRLPGFVFPGRRCSTEAGHFPGGNDMPVIAGFDQFASVPEEFITDKIRRRVVSGKQGTMVYWTVKAGAQVAAHKHPHEQFVWMIKGTMDFRIGDEKRTMKAGDVAVILGGIEHEGYFPEDSEVIDFFCAGA